MSSTGDSWGVAEGPDRAALGLGGKATMIELGLLCTPHRETVGEDGLPGPGRKQVRGRAEEPKEDCQNHVAPF